jgi:predicted Rossmann fold nucleotide-binding protein DprA/Smf involved in DNA uptake
MQTNNQKEALRQLREERKAIIERVRKMTMNQYKRISAINSQIEKEAKTIPELASALSMSPSDVLVTVSALRKYGKVVEGVKDGDYFKYQLPAKSS